MDTQRRFSKEENEKLIMCVDYRQLNNKKKDRYALSRIEELLYSLAGNTFFITVDINNGYHQVEILDQNLLLNHCDFMNTT